VNVAADVADERPRGEADARMAWDMRESLQDKALVLAAKKVTLPAVRPARPGFASFSERTVPTVPGTAETACAFPSRDHPFSDFVFDIRKLVEANGLPACAATPHRNDAEFIHFRQRNRLAVTDSLQ